MTGLIYKDMCCLRKNIKLFIFVTFGVIVMALLFVLSAQYGNVAKAVAEMQAYGSIGAGMQQSFYTIAIWVMLFIPLAFLATVTECFKEDRKAAFAKQMHSMPVSDMQIVGSRYLSCILFAVVSVLGSLLAAIPVSVASDAFTFKGLVGPIVFFCSALLIYMSIVMFCIYLIGSEKADLIQCIPFIVLLVAGEGYLAVKLSSVDDAAVSMMFQELLNGLLRLSTQKWMLFLTVALVCMVLSWLSSVAVLKMRREKI